VITPLASSKEMGMLVFHAQMHPMADLLFLIQPAHAQKGIYGTLPILHVIVIFQVQEHHFQVESASTASA
jgi:hypothetical protein